MASEWQTLPLEDCMAAIIDYRGKTPKKTTFGVPLVTAKVIKGGRIERLEEFIAEADFDAWMRRGMPSPGDIVMTTEAPLGEVAQLDGRKVALAQRVITLRGKPDVLDNTFLKFLLQSSSVQEELRSRGTGTTVVGIRQSELRKVSLTLPPLVQQKAIAAVLGALDDKIELNRRMNATLEAMARALFQSWFVDFDPVRAKLDGLKSTSLDRATASLFPESFDDSDIGPIPKGWKRCQLREIAEVFSGGTPRKDNESFWQGDIPWISPKAMTQIQVEDSDEHVSVAAIGNGTRQVPKGATLVMVRGMGLHQGVRVSQAQRDVTFNQDVKAIVATSVPDTLLFYGCLHAAPMLLSKVHASGHGTGVLSTEFLDRLEFVVPPNDTCDLLAQPLVALNSKISANNRESRTLATLRDTLLPKLLSGEVRV